MSTIKPEKVQIYIAPWYFELGFSPRTNRFFGYAQKKRFGAECRALGSGEMWMEFSSLMPSGSNLNDVLCTLMDEVNQVSKFTGQPPQVVH